MFMNHEAAPVWVWLVGRRPKKRTLAIAGFGGLLLGIVAFATNDAVWWANVILFALAFDLAAGLVSNLSHSTRSFWSSRSFIFRATYVVAHLTIYPLAIWALVSSDALGVFLSVVLGAKILAFIIGGLSKPTPDNLPSSDTYSS